MRKELEKRIRRKQADRDRVSEQIAQLTAERASIDAVINELESLVRLTPRGENGDDLVSAPDRDIRFGTEVYYAREVLQGARGPLYVGEILKSQGKDDSKGPRSSLASQLGSYARDGRIFTKEGPNIFGLIDYGDPVSEQDTTEPELDIKYAEPIRNTFLSDDDSDIPF